jgi:hypothetical protein
MDPTLLIALAGIGGFLVYEHGDKETAKKPSLPTSIGQTTSKFVPLNGKTVKPIVATVPAKANATVMPGAGGSPKNPWFVNIASNGSSGTAAKQTVGATQQLMDKAKAKIKKDYDKLSAKEKKAGAAALNKLIKPNPGLTGDETFAEAGRKVGAALGTATGTAIGAATGPFAPVFAPLGALAGAYLGAKLGDWVGGEWKNVENWASNTAENVKDKIVDKVNDVAHDIGHALHLV